MLCSFCCVFGVLVNLAVLLYLFGLFFFQAEDGIRDLVRSRGLGDVYKRQKSYMAGEKVTALFKTPFSGKMLVTMETDHVVSYPVSYTHLTLPTSDLV